MLTLARISARAAPFLRRNAFQLAEQQRERLFLDRFAESGQLRNSLRAYETQRLAAVASDTSERRGDTQARFHREAEARHRQNNARAPGYSGRGSEEHDFSRNLGVERRLWTQAYYGSLFLPGALAGFVLASSFEQQEEKFPDQDARWRFCLLTVPQERDIGAEGSQVLLADREARAHLLPPQHGITREIERIAKKLLHPNSLPAKPIQKPVPTWSVNVIDQPDTTNAMVLPDGSIFVYTGILEKCYSEDEVAVVLGHEIAHVLLRHGAEQLSSGEILSIPANFFAIFSLLAAGVGGLLLSKSAENLFGGLLLQLPQSRFCEREADELGLRISTLAGYNPLAAPQLWARMGSGADGEAELKKYVKERLERMKGWDHAGTGDGARLALGARGLFAGLLPAVLGAQRDGSLEAATSFAAQTSSANFAMSFGRGHAANAEKLKEGVPLKHDEDATVQRVGRDRAVKDALSILGPHFSRNFLEEAGLFFTPGSKGNGTRDVWDTEISSLSDAGTAGDPVATPLVRQPLPLETRSTPGDITAPTVPSEWFSTHPSYESRVLSLLDLAIYLRMHPNFFQKHSSGDGVAYSSGDYFVNSESDIVGQMNGAEDTSPVSSALRRFLGQVEAGFVRAMPLRRQPRTIEEWCEWLRERRRQTEAEKKKNSNVLWEQVEKRISKMVKKLLDLTPSERAFLQQVEFRLGVTKKEREDAAEDEIVQTVKGMQPHPIPDDKEREFVERCQKNEKRPPRVFECFAPYDPDTLSIDEICMSTSSTVTTNAGEGGSSHVKSLVDNYNRRTGYDVPVRGRATCPPGSAALPGRFSTTADAPTARMTAHPNVKTTSFGALLPPVAEDADFGGDGSTIAADMGLTGSAEEDKAARAIQSRFRRKKGFAAPAAEPAAIKTSPAAAAAAPPAPAAETFDFTGSEEEHTAAISIQRRFRRQKAFTSKNQEQDSSVLSHGGSPASSSSASAEGAASSADQTLISDLNSALNTDKDLRVSEFIKGAAGAAEQQTTRVSARA
eukprot:g19786.t1